jgi:hypothetical protein
MQRTKCLLYFPRTISPNHGLEAVCWKESLQLASSHQRISSRVRPTALRQFRLVICTQCETFQ